MTRHLLSAVGVAFLVAAVGDQGPKSLSANDRARLYQKNRVVIELLVAKTVESSHSPSNPIRRAETYYGILFDFNTRIKKAQGDKDDARVEELAGHLATLLDKGFYPTLDAAHTMMKDGTGLDEYHKVKDDLLAQLSELLVTLDDEPAVKQSLAKAKNRVSEIDAPKKK